MTWPLNLFGPDKYGYDRWTLDIQHGLPAWVVGIGAIFLIGILILLWYNLRDLKIQRRTVLFAFRFLAVIFLAFILLKPVIKLEKLNREKGFLATLVDTSYSMSLPIDEKGTPRIEKVDEFLKNNRDSWQDWDDDFRTHFFRFSNTLHLPGDSGLKNRDLVAIDMDTDIYNSLSELIKLKDISPLGGIILFSDGVDHGPLKFFEDRGQRKGYERILKDWDVPVYTFGFLSPRSGRDLSIEEVEVDEYSFIRNPTRIRVLLKARGFGSEEVILTLKGEGTIEATKTLNLDPQKGNYIVDFEIFPKKTGDFIYSVQIPGHIEEDILVNNRMDFRLNVLRDKVRILLIAGHPSWELRFFRKILKENPNIDLVNFNILRTPIDIVPVHQHELSLIPFPTNELFTTELKGFDLLVFMDFNFHPHPLFPPYLKPHLLKNIRDFVTKDGGGFMIMGGDDSFQSEGYGGTPIEEILPIGLVKSGPLVDTGEFRMNLTDRGKVHYITTLRDDPKKNIKAWENMPMLTGCNIISGMPRQGAEILGVHPNLQHEGRPIPILSIREVGEGRTLAFASDTSWHWYLLELGSGGRGMDYYTFWYNAIKWLTKDPDTKPLKLTIEREKIDASQTLKPIVKLSGISEEDLGERTVELMHGVKRIKAYIIGASGDTEEIKDLRLRRVTGHKDLWEVDLKDKTLWDSPGIYKIRIELKNRDRIIGWDESIFEVVGAEEESKDLIPNSDVLKYLSQITGGRFFHIGDDINLNKELRLRPVKRENLEKQLTIPLWDNPIVFVLAVCLLCACWILRRIWGLN